MELDIYSTPCSSFPSPLQHTDHLSQSYLSGQSHLLLPVLMSTINKRCSVWLIDRCAPDVEVIFWERWDLSEIANSRAVPCLMDSCVRVVMIFFFTQGEALPDCLSVSRPAAPTDWRRQRLWAAFFSPASEKSWVAQFVKDTDNEKVSSSLSNVAVFHTSLLSNLMSCVCSLRRLSCSERVLAMDVTMPAQCPWLKANLPNKLSH